MSGSYLGSEELRLANLAPRGDRLIAQFVDEVIAIGPALVGFGLATFSETVGSIIMLVGIVFALLYTLLADGLIGGQSYGKRLMTIAVIDASTGQPCTFMKSFIRNLLLLLLGIIDWIFIFGKRRQRLGDMAANTIVVKAMNSEEKSAT